MTERSQCGKVGCECTANAPLRGRHGIRGGVDARETRDQALKVPLLSCSTMMGEVLRLNPASLRIRRARPVPTAFVVGTDTVTSRPVSGCTN